MTIEWMIKHLQLTAESSKDKKHELSKISITNEQLSEHCEQIVKWLEELKDLREYKERVEWVVKTQSQIREDAIDECLNLVKSRSDDDRLMNEYYVELLEELKEQKND